MIERTRTAIEEIAIGRCQAVGVFLLTLLAGAVWWVLTPDYTWYLDAVAVVAFVLFGAWMASLCPPFRRADGKGWLDSAE